ncbi:MAG: ABC transporter permease [Candidatus Eisenbacteria bacterium]
MNFVRQMLIISHLTLHEAMRRRILLATLVCGGGFLTVFGIGLHFIVKDLVREGGTMLQQRITLNMLTLAGLYAVNFLTVMSAVLLPIDTLSGDVASGVIQTVASKPIARSGIVLGKWLAYWLVTACYLLLMAGGVILLARFIGHFKLQGVSIGLPLMLLEATVLMSLSIAGGTRFSTVTNGIVGFGMFGLAFIGNLVEQIGTFARNDAARYVGTVTSLLMPSDSMWQLAASHMQPAIMRQMNVSPFSPASVPSAAMVWWAAGYALVLVLLAIRGLSRRAL